MKPRIKVCCISSMEEAELAINFGADAIGLVGKMPSGPGVITDSLISKIVTKTPPAVSTFLLSSKTSAEEIINDYKKVNTSTLQLVDSVSLDTYVKIRENFPHVKIVQVIHVIDRRSITESINVSDYVDGLLLDSGNPNLKIKELGGTGRTHDWELSKEIVNLVSIPVFLAGGINPENVVEAIQKVQPFGIDLCSGVRTNDKLDKKKLDALFNQINSINF